MNDNMKTAEEKITAMELVLHKVIQWCNGSYKTPPSEFYMEMVNASDMEYISLQELENKHIAKVGELEKIIEKQRVNISERQKQVERIFGTPFPDEEDFETILGLKDRIKELDILGTFSINEQKNYIAKIEQLKSQLSKGISKDQEEFITACKNERIEFCKKILEYAPHEQEHINSQTKIRVASENILVMYDQLISRLQERMKENK